MARAKYWLEKNDKRYRVLKFNKAEQTVKLRGELTDFETGLEKALNSGYKLVKDVSNDEN